MNPEIIGGILGFIIGLTLGLGYYFGLDLWLKEKIEKLWRKGK